MPQTQQQQQKKNEMEKDQIPKNPFIIQINRHETSMRF